MSCKLEKPEKLSDFCRKHFFGLKIPIDCGIELTDNCNLKCVHCYIHCNKKKASLSTEKIINIIDELYDLGCVNILYSGGECLLRKDFLEIYKYTRLKGMSVVVLSNATLLEQKHIDYFLEYPISYFSTTMYGLTKETYEKITGIPGSHRKFLRGISLLKNNNINFEIKSVALTINKHEILGISDFAKQLNVPFRYSTSIRVKNDLTEENMIYRLSAKEAFWFDINDPVRRNFWENVALYPKKQEFCDSRRAQCYKYICHAGDQSIWIQSDGSMRVCSKDLMHKINVNKTTIQAGWNNFIPHVINQKIDREKYACLDCKYFRYCEQCIADIESEGLLDKLPNSFYCELAKLRYEFCHQICQQAKLQKV